MWSQALQWVFGEEHDCEYLPGRPARSAFVISPRNSAGSVYTELVKLGFRRSGDLVYRPHCRECQACIPVRIPVAKFIPSRIQRRTWKKNSDLVVKTYQPDFKQSHFELYQRYLQARHPDGSMSDPEPHDYIRFLCSDWAGTLFYEFSLDSQVVAVSVLDHCETGLSAVYSFFEPRLSKRSLGSYSILWAIEETRRLNLQSLYLGYWVDACQKMTYKADYKPIECYIGGQWQLTKDCRNMVSSPN